MVRVCEIELSHMGKNNGNRIDLVCEKTFLLNTIIVFFSFVVSTHFQF